ATLTATSTRLITKDLRKGGDPFVHRQMFNLFSHVVIIPSAAIYAVLKYQSLKGSSEMNLHYVTWVSILMLLSAVVFSFFVFLFDEQRSSPATAEAFNRELRQEEANLSRQFDALEKKDADGE